MPFIKLKFSADSILTLVTIAAAAVGIPATSGVASALDSDLLICQDTESIEIETCAVWDTTSEIPAGTMTFRWDGECLGEPKTAEEPVCFQSLVLASKTRLPISEAFVELHWLEEGSDRAATILVRNSDGLIHVPSWVNTVRVESPGFEDWSLDLVDLAPTIFLRRGRTVLFFAGLSPVGTKIEEIDLEFDGQNVESKKSFAAPLNRVHDLGSLPLGRYSVALTGENIASYHRQVNIEDGVGPLQMEFSVDQGACLTVPMDISNAPDVSMIDYVLTQTPPNQFAAVYRSGTAKLMSTPDPEIRKVEFCAVAPSQYELELEGKGVGTEYVTLEVEKTGTVAPTVTLVSSTRTILEIIDETNQPVPGARAILKWRNEGKRQGTERFSDARGKVAVPSFPEPTSLRGSVTAEGFRPNAFEFSSLQNHVVILEPQGYLTAEIERQACSESRFFFSLESPCGYAKDCWFEEAGFAMDDCRVAQPIRREGTYQITITSDHFARFQEVVSIGGDLNYDLGTINPEPGHGLEVTVTADGRPVEGATVAIEGFAPARYSDRGGLVQFSSLEEELRSVVLLASSNESPLIRQEVPIPDDRRVEIQLPRAGAIFGKVFKEDGLPAAGQLLSLSTAGMKPRGSIIGFDGSYRFDKVPPGKWSLARTMISATSWSFFQGTGHSTTTVHLNEGEELEVNLIPEIEVYGRVTLAGEILPNSGLAATYLGDTTALYTRLTSDETGMYRARLPRTGTWLFEVEGAACQASIVGPCPCLVDITLER